MTMTYECPYCGCERIIDVADNATKAQMMDAAAAACDCDEARHAQELNAVRVTVRRIFGEDGKERFGYTCEEYTINALISIGRMMIFEEIDSATMVLPKGDKCVMKMKDGHIHIQRIQKRSCEVMAKS